PGDRFAGGFEDERMRHRFQSGAARAQIGVLALVLVALAAPRPAVAEEAYQKFLEGLRERGLFDMALEYIGQMRGSPLVSEELRQRMPYEEGVTLIHAAQAERDA